MTNPIDFPAIQAGMHRAQRVALNIAGAQAEVSAAARDYRVAVQQVTDNPNDHAMKLRMLERADQLSDRHVRLAGLLKAYSELARPYFQLLVDGQREEQIEGPQG